MMNINQNGKQMAEMSEDGAINSAEEKTLMFSFPFEEAKTNAPGKFFWENNSLLLSHFRSLGEQRERFASEANSEANYKFPEPVIRRRSETV
jgi:hypothetical protein